MTPFHAISSVFVKAVYNRPLLNRFVQGHRVYDRNDVSISFVAKNKKDDNSKDMMVMMKANSKENALDFSKRVAVDIFNTKKEETNDLNNIINGFLCLPRWLLKLVVRVFKWLDYHGWLPKAYTDTDSNYATILFSNLGSIKSSSCYHHLNNYGTNSIIITIGMIRKENSRYIVDIAATLDERIASGFYFSKSIKLVQYILDNPKLLEDELSSKIEYKKD